MSKVIVAACFLAMSYTASAETYGECLKRVLDQQAKCEAPCTKSAEACRKCNEGVRRMQKRCEEQTRDGEAGERKS
jgi:hypothetical protein